MKTSRPKTRLGLTLAHLLALALPSVKPRERQPGCVDSASRDCQVFQLRTFGGDCR